MRGVVVYAVAANPFDQCVEPLPRQTQSSYRNGDLMVVNDVVPVSEFPAE